MSILIEGMEMPKETTLISIGPGGTVEIHRNDDLTWVPLKEKAISVPEPHGRLGDLDELYVSLKKWLMQNRHSMTKATRVWIRGVLEGIAAAPTVIPASGTKVE